MVGDSPVIGVTFDATLDRTCALIVAAVGQITKSAYMS
jgi:hypothetical protein